MAMIAITTNNSIKVNPRGGRGFGMRETPKESAPGTKNRRDKVQNDLLSERQRAVCHGSVSRAEWPAVMEARAAHRAVARHSKTLFLMGNSATQRVFSGSENLTIKPTAGRGSHKRRASCSRRAVWSPRQTLRPARKHPPRPPLARPAADGPESGRPGNGHRATANGRENRKAPCCLAHRTSSDGDGASSNAGANARRWFPRRKPFRNPANGRGNGDGRARPVPT